MSIVIGIGGARRNASAALAIDGRLIAACEEERFTRVRGVGSIRCPSSVDAAILGVASKQATYLCTTAIGFGHAGLTLVGQVEEFAAIM